MIYENSSDLKFSMANKMQCESEDDCDSDENVWRDDFSDTEEEEEKFLETNSHSYLIKKPLPPEPGEMVSNYDVPRIHYKVQSSKDDLLVEQDELYDTPDSEKSGNPFKLRDVFPKDIIKRNPNVLGEGSNAKEKPSFKQKNSPPEITPKKPNMLTSKQLTQDNGKSSKNLPEKRENDSVIQSNDLYEDPTDSPLSGDAFRKQLLIKLKPQTSIRLPNECNNNKRDNEASTSVVPANISPINSLANNQRQFQDRPLPVFPNIREKFPEKKLNNPKSLPFEDNIKQSGPTDASPNNPFQSIKKLQFQDRPLPILPNDNESSTKMESTQQQQNEELLSSEYEICDQQNLSQTNSSNQHKPALKERKPVKPVVSEPISKPPCPPSKQYIPTPAIGTCDYTYVPTDDVPLFPQNICVPKVFLPPPDVYEPPDVPISFSEKNSRDVLEKSQTSFISVSTGGPISPSSSINTVTKPPDLPSRKNMPPKPKPKITPEIVTVEPTIVEKPSIPVRTIQPAPKTVIGDQLNQISEKMWYHGDISREDSVDRLKSWNKESSFLVRDTNKWDGYSLSIFHKGNVTHLSSAQSMITLKENHYYLGTSEKPFKSVENLIGFYQTTLLSLASGGEICLKSTPPRVKDTK